MNAPALNVRTSGVFEGTSRAGGVETGVETEGETPDEVLQRWVKLLDQDRCIGCHACTTACKSENEVPLGVTRTYVKSADVGRPPGPPGVPGDQVQSVHGRTLRGRLPDQAMYRRPDGIVDFDKEICVGCKACIAACPYDAIFINPEDHSAEKCNLCAHRLDIGLEGLRHGLPDRRHPGRGPERPLLRGGPDRARAGDRAPPGEGDPAGRVLQGCGSGDAGPAGGPPAGRRSPGLGHPGRRGPGMSRRPSRPPNSSAAALLSYDIPHFAPWGWRVSLYTWTKGIAAGALLVPLILVLAGRLAWNDPVARWAAPGLALGFLGRHRGPADLGPEAPAALLPDLHPASLAELAGPRVVHHRWLRGRGHRLPARITDRVGAHPAGRRGLAMPLGDRRRLLHRVPVRPGQGA